ncbi:LexA family protein [Nonomuraea thailandensis]
MTSYDDHDAFEYVDFSALPQRQQRILATIRDWVARHGYPPSTRELGRAVGLRSPSSVSKHLRSLEERGLLRRSTTVTRPIDVRPFLRAAAPEPPPAW